MNTNTTIGVVNTTLSTIYSARFCLEHLPRHSDPDTRYALQRTLGHLINAYESLLDALELLEQIESSLVAPKEQSDG